jgi:hypothetical protein
MKMFSAWVSVVSGIYLVLLGIVFNVGDFVSGFLFKILPIVLGILLIISSLFLFGFVVTV